jgi:hypothetical protein
MRFEKRPNEARDDRGKEDFAGDFKPCKKTLKTSPPLSPPRWGGLGWGARDTGAGVLGPSKKPLGSFKFKGEIEVSENLIETITIEPMLDIRFRRRFG